MSFYAPRLKTFSYRGAHRYALTLCVSGRRRVFVSDAAVGVVLTRLAENAAQAGFEIPVYCFMPDHLHLLATSGGHSGLDSFMRRFKQTSEFAFRRQCCDRLWQRSYWDRVLREDEQIFVVARYVLANPVRGRLVEDPRSYPYSGSLCMDRDDLFRSAFEART
jgi:REP element-mobilizing transposase RayT